MVIINDIVIYIVKINNFYNPNRSYHQHHTLIDFLFTRSAFAIKINTVMTYNSIITFATSFGKM